MSCYSGSICPINLEFCTIVAVLYIFKIVDFGVDDFCDFCIIVILNSQWSIVLGLYFQSMGNSRITYCRCTVVYYIKCVHV